MYKIFIGDLAIHLISKVPKKFPKAKPEPLVILYSEASNLLNVIELAEGNESDTLSDIYVVSESVATLFEDFCTHYKLLDAAGGIVFNEREEALFIFRLGKWDLPKGKAEKGESIQETAVREVEEETGLGGVAITEAIEIAANQKNVTYHTYRHFKTQKRILKTTYWYKMSAKQITKISPQTEEGIESVNWVAKDKIADCLENTYASITDVVKACKSV